MKRPTVLSDKSIENHLWIRPQMVCVSFPLQSRLPPATKMILTTCTCVQDVCSEKSSYLHSLCPAAFSAAALEVFWFCFFLNQRPERKFSLLQMPTDETKASGSGHLSASPSFLPQSNWTHEESLFEPAQEEQPSPDAPWPEWGG